jgi:glutaredoxin-like protein
VFQSYGLDLRNIESKFKELRNEVKLVFFTQETDCAHCNLAKRVFERVASVSQKVDFEVYNVAANEMMSQHYRVFAVPALAIIGARDYGIRYYGYPRGVEIDGFLDDVVYISRGENALSDGILGKLAHLDGTVHLKIFVSPEYHYSLSVARLGLRLAVASEFIHVDIIDAIAFLEIAEKYGIRSIPMTVVNDSESFQGAPDEEDYVDEILARARGQENSL